MLGTFQSAGGGPTQSWAGPESFAKLCLFGPENIHMTLENIGIRTISLRQLVVAGFRGFQLMEIFPATAVFQDDTFSKNNHPKWVDVSPYIKNGGFFQCDVRFQGGGYNFHKNQGLFFGKEHHKKNQ